MATPDPPSPRAFMRSRRPEAFSDSVQENEQVLDRTLLEFELSTLGTRGQERPFEEFARKVCQRAICSNLMPHSGGDAGGDGKVDTETYPVAPTIAAAWYVGSPESASAERWAFAISTQKRWRPKATADVEKIVATARGYTKVFFISSEAIRDKARTKAEDELRSKCGIEVRILDRNWLLDQVFDRKLEDLAIDELQMSATLKPLIRKGPNDTARENDLAEIEERIRTALAESRSGPSVVADSIAAAEIAASLERSRTDVDGMFMRAQRFARDMGTSHQQVLSLYSHARTTFWHFEDLSTFSVLYTQVEALVRGTENSYELTLLHTLWTLLVGIVGRRQMGNAEAQLDERTSSLQAELERLAGDETRFSAALDAKTTLVLMRLMMSRNEADADTSFGELQDIAKQAVRLVGYPIKHLADMISAMGERSPSPAYDSLLETIVDLMSKHDGEVTAGRLLSNRGLQQLRNDKPYDAIRSLGRSLSLLYKHETRYDVIRALVVCGAVYERLDLLWAARGSYAAAAALATQDLLSKEKFTIVQADCFKRMKWIELRHGRLPHVLAWHEVDRAICSGLAAEGRDPERLLRDEPLLDAMLGRSILRADLDVVAALTRLPDVLASLDLINARTALLFALGREDAILPAFADKPDAAAAMREYFVEWRDQPVEGTVAGGLTLLVDDEVTLTTTVLGCQITCKTARQSPYLELAETLLATVESYLATAFEDRVVAREPHVLVTIESGEIEGNAPFTFTVDDGGRIPQLRITCASFDAHRMPAELQARVKSSLSDLVAHLLGLGFMFPDGDAILLKLIRDERVNDRALNFTGSFVVISNVMGDGAKLTMPPWLAGQQEYALRRATRWDSTLSPTSVPTEALRPVIHDATAGGAPLRTDAPHRNIEFLSPIRQALWNRADWAGAIFLTADDDRPPVLGLIFKNREPAAQIFSGLREQLGDADEHDRLRVSIVRRFDSSNPAWYRMVIGGNLETIPVRPGQFFAAMTQIVTATPNTTENLDRFLESYRRSGRYLLVPAAVEPGGAMPSLVLDLGVLKTTLKVKDAWEIGLGDPDAVAIHASDTPVIPSTEGHAPVLDLIERKKQGLTDPG